MIFDRETIKALEKIREESFEGIVFRHMFAELSPERENVSGARWNPVQVPAIYTSLKREVVIAEADYQISLQPFRPRAVRKVYQINVVLSSVLNLSDWNALASLGLNKESFSSIDHTTSQSIGGAVEWLGHDGLLVPSARTEGTNLVIYPNQQRPSYKFEIIDYEELEP